MILDKTTGINDAVRKKAVKMSYEDFIAMFGDNGLNADMPKQERVMAIEETAVVEVDNGQLTMNGGPLFGGKITANKGDGLRIVGYGPEVGGIWLNGETTDFILEDSYIYIDGDSPVHNNAGGGKYNPIYVDHGAKLTLRNSIVYSSGCERHALGCANGSELHVYDSIIGSHGAPYGDNLPNGYQDRTVTKGNILAGNARATSAGSNTKSYYYNSTITAEGWGALATDGGGDGIYLEANNCRIITSKSGYGTYADGGSRNVFNGCSFNCGRMSVILAGESKAEFHSCKSNNGSHFAVIYCVISPSDAETAELLIAESYIESLDEAILVKSANAMIHVVNSSLHSESGVLVRGVVNDDKDATKVTSNSVYGINVFLEKSNLTGNLVNEDTDREMYVHLKNATLTGALRNVILYMDDSAQWIADEDSEIFLGSQLNLACVDATPGVMILVHGNCKYEAILPSGGVIKVICD